MKYIRTKDGIYIRCEINGYKDYYCLKGNTNVSRIDELNVLKQADIIEELCDEFVVHYKNGYHSLMQKLKWAEIEEYNASLVDNSEIIYGAIWTDKGLIYVAKMNEKGELELL